MADQLAGMERDRTEETYLICIIKQHVSFSNPLEKVKLCYQVCELEGHLEERT